MSDQMDDKFAVSLTRCFYCGKSNEIILNRRLTEHVANQVKEMDGKVISMQPCQECEENMKQGVILLTIDPHKSDPDWHMPPKDDKEREHWMPNPHRTGGYFVLRDEAIQRMFDKELADYACKARWSFIEHEAATQIGLFEAVDEEGDNDAPKTGV